MRRSSRVFSFVLVASFLAPAPSAFAQAPAAPLAPDAAAVAADLKKRGDDAMDALRYDDALASYDRAYALSRDPALLYNQGRALQALSRYPESVAKIEQFARDASPELKARVPRLDELVAELRSHVARLAIHCDVPNARVLVRDRVVGTTPVPRSIGLDAGHATIEIDADGYEPYRRELDLAGGTTTALDVQLVERATGAFVKIESTAASATVFLDGAPLGNAPVEATVTPGSHTVAMHRDGYEDVKSTFVVAAGEHKDVTLEPQKNPPITTKWWFWTAVGAVVVGGVVVTYAALKEKPAAQGDSFSPSQVSAPIVKF